MSDDEHNIKMKLTFAPGAFDSWEGSQEELDQLVEIIKSKFEDGSLFEDSVPLEQLLEHSPEVVEFVEGLTDEEVTEMLQPMDTFALHPEVNRTLH